MAVLYERHLPGRSAALGARALEDDQSRVLSRRSRLKVLGGDVFNFLVVSSVFLVAFSVSAATLYLREDEHTGKLISEHSIADYFFMQFMWAIVEYPLKRIVSIFSSNSS